MLLLSAGALAQAASLYALFSLVAGAWTAGTGGVSPARWLACLALPVALASRGLRRGTLAASGAIAIMQVGFTLCLARLGLLFALGAHLELYPVTVERQRGTSRPQARTYWRVWSDCSVACCAAALFLVEVGVAVDDWLDFRTSFTATWLSLTALASFTLDAHSLTEDRIESAFSSARRGAIVTVAYNLGAYLASAPLSPFSALSTAPSQTSLVVVGALGGAIGALTVPLLHQMMGFDDSSGRSSLLPLANAAAALILPRVALAMDAQGSSLWNAIGSLSSQ